MRSTRLQQYAYAVAVLEYGSRPDRHWPFVDSGTGHRHGLPGHRDPGRDLVGKEIGELMGGFGDIFRQIAYHPQLRWLGPHKGVAHLAGPP